MFGSKTRRELAAALAENTAAGARTQSLHDELAATQARLARAEAENLRLTTRQALLDGVLGNIPRFGESLSGIRQSFSGLSDQLN